MKSDFIIAVDALVFLQHKNEWLSSERIAENVCTNPAYLRKVMARLVKAGLVEKREGGSKGGYSLKIGRPISLLEVADALGARFVEPAYHSGDEEKECLIASGMAAFTGELCAELDDRCRERLSEITVAEIERDLIRRKQEKNKVKGRVGT